MLTSSALSPRRNSPTATRPLRNADYCYESTTSPTTIVTLTQEGVEGVDLDRGRAYRIFPRTYTSAADRTQCQAACLADTRCDSWTHMYKAEPPDAENPSWSCYLLQLRAQGSPPCPIFRPGEEAGHKNLYWSGVRTPINITRANCPCAGEADMVERLHYTYSDEPWSLSSKMLSNPEDFGCAAMQGRSYGDRDLEQCQVRESDACQLHVGMPRDICLLSRPFRTGMGRVHLATTPPSLTLILPTYV